MIVSLTGESSSWSVAFVAIVSISKNLGWLYMTETMNDATIIRIDVDFFIRCKGATTAISRSMVTLMVASTEPTLAMCASPNLEQQNRS